MRSHYQVVVCCAGADAPYAARLVKFLSEILDCSVFFYKSIPIGTNWTEALRTAIEAAYVVIVIHSKNSVGNTQVDDEVLRARMSPTVTYFPLYLDQLSVNERVATSSATQFLELTREWPPEKEVLERIRDDVYGMILQNGPGVHRRIVERVNAALRQETERRKKAEDKSIQGVPIHPSIALLMRRILDLVDAMARIASDALERTRREPHNTIASIDDVSDDLVTRLHAISQEAARAQQHSDDEALRGQIEDARRETDNLSAMIGLAR